MSPWQRSRSCALASHGDATCVQCQHTVLRRGSVPVLEYGGHLATTAAGAGCATGAGSAASPAPSARRAAGVACGPVLAALPESATVEGVDALSPISLHISSAACVRLQAFVSVGVSENILKEFKIHDLIS